MVTPRTVSVAVSYILLVAVAAVADAILVSTYVGFVSRSVGWVPHVVYEISQGLVYGVYMMSPCTIEVREVFPPGGMVTYTVTLPCLHISVVNPNPVPVEVILLGHVPSSLLTGYKVLDLLTSFGLYWDTSDGNPPPGVSVVKSPSWLVEPIGSLGPGVYRAIRMNPGASATFRVPLTYAGTPSEVLACTKVGCTKLHTVGAQVIIQRPSATWILYPSDQQPRPPQDVQASPTYSLTQTWEWKARTLGGQPIGCQPKMERLTMPRRTAMVLPAGGLCCGMCPPETFTVPYKLTDEKRGACGFDEGYIVSPSALLGYPPRVLLGFFTTDQNFDFKVPPSSVNLDGRTYKLYGFDSSNYYLISSQYSLAVGKWATYEHKECNRRVVTLTASVFADPSKTVPLSTIYTNSKKLYVYGVTCGYVEMVSLFFARYDNVNITVIGRYITGQGTVEEQRRTVAVADRMPINVFGYAALDMEGLVEVVIQVTYEMVGEEPFYCYLDYILGVYCGADYDRHVRLAFYVELIPDEFLR